MLVLIAEDDDASRLILEAELKNLGHDVLAAPDGEKAWQLYEHAAVDAVISDRSMPGVDGIELCRRIRRAPKHPYSYFIFVTSHGEKASILDGMGAGADDYLTKPFDPTELAARLIVAERISQVYRTLASQKAELELLNKKLFDQARVDPLTGLASRRKLNEDLERVWADIHRYGGGYSAVMCDVDYFKRFNDQYGHLAGDDTLRRVADALSENCRGNDRVYRYGGEEFLIIMRRGFAQGAARAAERYRAAVDALAIPHSSSPMGHVTISLGIAEVDASTSRNSADWLKQADAALYMAKSRGRNTVATLAP